MDNEKTPPLASDVTPTEQQTTSGQPESAHETLPATVFYTSPEAEQQAEVPTPEDPAINRLEGESPAPDPVEFKESAGTPEQSAVPPPPVDVTTRLQELYPAPTPQPVPVEPESSAESEPPVAIPASGSGVSNDLEEQIFAPSVPQQGPQAGQQFGEWQLQNDLGRGWFTALHAGETEPQTVYVRPDPQWAGLLAHRLLPHTEQRGNVHVVDQPTGTPLTAPLAPAEAMAHLGDLARLLFALEKQGYALTDIDPAHIVQTAEGLKLQLPPRVVRLGEPDPGALRDGLTAPEVLAGQPAQASAGVYLLGAVLYQWLTGQAPPPGGPSLIELGSLKVPGVPQLLAGMLAPAEHRTTPQELLDILRRMAAASLPLYRIAARTTVGLNPDRPANEDSYGYEQRQIESDAEEEFYLRACVSDGMGGMAAGEVASQAAVKAFLSSDKPDLTGMVWDANAAVLQAMNGRDGGCTISGVEIKGTRMQLGHVGDTRIYLRANGEVRQLSQDHSFVAAMVASGQMTPEEAQVSPERNKVLRSLGSLRQPQQDYVQTLAEPLELPVGSRLLLVSDGVWGEVEPATLSDLLLNEADIQVLADRLITLSLEAGAPDNATALVIERTA